MNASTEISHAAARVNSRCVPAEDNERPNPIADILQATFEVASYISRRQVRNISEVLVAFVKSIDSSMSEIN